MFTVFFWTAEDEGTISAHGSRHALPCQCGCSGETVVTHHLAGGACPGEKKARALPALHAKMELHFARFCIKSGTFARLRRKWAVSPLTTDARFLHPIPPDAQVRPPPPTPGRWSLSCVALPLKPPRRVSRLPSSESRPAREETPAWCRWPVGLLATASTRLR